MTEENEKKDKASAHGAPRDATMKVHAHPPSHFLASCLVTVALGAWGRGNNMIWPQRARHDMIAVGVGGFLASMGLAWTAMKTFRQNQTPIPHGYRVQTLVRDGVFSVSRNPIYVAMVTGVASLGVALNTWWGGVAALYLTGTLQWRVIPYEEAYLSKTFGKTYEDYKAKVPRWILFF